jgi:hypothetical protein
MKSYNKISFVVLGLIILNVLMPLQSSAQSKAKIENVDFFPDGSTLIITYDIVKYKRGETFKVWVNVYTENGNKIIPNELMGDIGPNIIGGPDKRIIWDMEADKAYLDEDIAVVVLAESELYIASNKKVENPAPVEQKQKREKQGISVGGAIGLDLVLPGLGRRIATKKGVGYLWGIAGYGCIAGSYFMNNSAYNTYEDYKKALTANERDDLFKKAKNQDLYSKVLIGGAAIIWITDLIVTGIKAGKIRKSSNYQRLSFYSTFDSHTQQPLMGIQFRF